MTIMVKWFCCSAFCNNDFRTRNSKGEPIKFYRLPREKVQVAYTRILQTSGINWHSGHICAEHWSCGCRESVSSDLPDIPVPASQLVTLEKKLNNAKAQLKKKTTKADKLKVRQHERKFFLAKGMSGNARKRKTPAERDNFQPAAKKPKDLCKRQLSTCLRASEEDKQKLVKQLTNAQDMVKKPRTENLSLKIKMRNIEQIQQKTTKRNEELKMTIKMLQQEQLIYSNLIKKPNTFKYLCGLSVEQFNILWICVRPYCHVIIYPDCEGNGDRTLDKLQSF